jgi:excisionase family DNA binding protein
MRSTTKSPSPISIPAAADRLGVSLYTVRAWIRSRRIPHLKLGRRVLVDPRDVEALLRAARVPSKYSAPAEAR